MISGFFQELKRYTQPEMCNILGCTPEKLVSLIRILKNYGFLKTVKYDSIQRDSDELTEEEEEIAEILLDDNEYYYVFTFVGVITVHGCVFKCYPKYLRNEDDYREKLKTVLKVLEKYNSKNQIVRMFNDTNDGRSFNILAVLLFLLNNYFENGSYSNTKDIIENNGSGEILWDKTINETFMYLSNNRPYYTELQTRKRVNDDYDYFKRLHECIITKASKELEEADLLDLFEMSGADLSDEEIDDFGDKEYILYRIEKELNVQFNTYKQIILKTIYAYVDRNQRMTDSEGLSMFGTNSFNLVWEDICKDILNNRLEETIGMLPLPVPLKPGYDRTKKLIDLIEKPFWSATGKEAEKTLIPDLITISGSGENCDFIIFDAKYYTAVLVEGHTPKKQPGIESVTKQYLYQLAYQKFISDHCFAHVRNCFLLPTSYPGITDNGEVSMKMLENLGLENIKVRFVSADLAYSHYLNGTLMNVEDLNL